MLVKPTSLEPLAILAHGEDVTFIGVRVIRSRPNSKGNAGPVRVSLGIIPGITSVGAGFQSAIGLLGETLS